MSENAQKLKEERSQLYNDFYNNIVPKRMPINGNIPLGYLAHYAKTDLKEVQYDFSLLKDACNELADLTYSDSCPMMGGADCATYHQSLGSTVYLMGADGFLQHPNAVGMYEEDYDAFIADPLATMVDTIVPRLYKNLDPKNHYNMMKAYTIAKKAEAKDIAAFGEIINPIKERKGYYPGPPRGSKGHSLAPMDFLADQCRSMSEISKDIRRNPQKIIDASDAIYPYIFALQTPSNPHPEGSVSTPLHMPTYMREKDFVKLWLPSYKRMIQEWASIGVRTSAFLETDWTRYYDIVKDEFPCGMMLRLEEVDPQTAKDKLGDKFIIGQMYPLSMLRHGTKQEVLDKAKEILDIMLPGCGYMFGFGTFPIVPEDINLENYIALMEFVRDYAVYDNAGEKYGMPLNSEGFKFDLTKSRELKSKYVFNWEEYKKENPYTPDHMRADLEKYEAEFMNFYLSLFD